MIPAAQIPKITTDFKIFFTDVVRNFFTKKYISEAAQISVITIEYVPGDFDANIYSGKTVTNDERAQIKIDIIIIFEADRKKSFAAEKIFLFIINFFYNRKGGLTSRN